MRVIGVPSEGRKWIVYVLTGHSLQKWMLSVDEPDQLIFVADLTRSLIEGFCGTVWENCNTNQADAETWILDIQPDKNSVILLACAVNVHFSPQIHYAMMCLQTDTTKPPSCFDNFLVLKMTGLYQTENLSESLSYRFLLSGTYAYIYNRRSITVVRAQEEPDVLEFNSPHDFLLGEWIHLQLLYSIC